MKKVIIGIVVIAAVALVVWALFFRNDKPLQITEQENVNRPIVSVTTQGEITAIDSEQAMVDGPYVITIDQMGSDESATIHVPSMGINLCKTSQIADVGALKVGDTIRVRGSRNEEGAIVPCESSTHFVKVVEGGTTPVATPEEQDADEEAPAAAAEAEAEADTTL